MGRKNKNYDKPGLVRRFTRSLFSTEDDYGRRNKSKANAKFRKLDGSDKSPKEDEFEMHKSIFFAEIDVHKHSEEAFERRNAFVDHGKDNKLDVNTIKRRSSSSLRVTKKKHRLLLEDDSPKAEFNPSFDNGAFNFNRCDESHDGSKTSHTASLTASMPSVDASDHRTNNSNNNNNYAFPHLSNSQNTMTLDAKPIQHKIPPFDPPATAAAPMPVFQHRLTHSNLAAMAAQAAESAEIASYTEEGIENRNPRTSFHQFTIDEDRESTVILSVGSMDDRFGYDYDDNDDDDESDEKDNEKYDDYNSSYDSHHDDEAEKDTPQAEEAFPAFDFKPASNGFESSLHSSNGTRRQTTKEEFPSFFPISDQTTTPSYPEHSSRNNDEKIKKSGQSESNMFRAFPAFEETETKSIVDPSSSHEIIQNHTKPNLFDGFLAFADSGEHSTSESPLPRTNEKTEKTLKDPVDMFADFQDVDQADTLSYSDDEQPMERQFVEFHQKSEPSKKKEKVGPSGLSPGFLKRNSKIEKPPLDSVQNRVKTFETTKTSDGINIGTQSGTGRREATMRKPTFQLGKQQQPPGQEKDIGLGSQLTIQEGFSENPSSIQSKISDQKVQNSALGNDNQGFPVLRTPPRTASHLLRPKSQPHPAVKKSGATLDSMQAPNSASRVEKIRPKKGLIEESSTRLHTVRGSYSASRVIKKLQPQSPSNDDRTKSVSVDPPQSSREPLHDDSAWFDDQKNSFNGTRSRHDPPTRAPLSPLNGWTTSQGDSRGSASKTKKFPTPVRENKGDKDFVSFESAAVNKSKNQKREVLKDRRQGNKALNEYFDSEKTLQVDDEQDDYFPSPTGLDNSRMFSSGFSRQRLPSISSKEDSFYRDPVDDDDSQSNSSHSDHMLGSAGQRGIKRRSSTTKEIPIGIRARQNPYKVRLSNSSRSRGQSNGSKNGSATSDRRLGSRSSRDNDNASQSTRGEESATGSYAKPTGLPNNAIVASMLFRTRHNIDSHVVEAKIKAKELENSRMTGDKSEVPRTIHADPDAYSCVSSFSEDTDIWRKRSNDLLDYFSNTHLMKSQPGKKLLDDEALFEA